MQASLNKRMKNYEQVTKQFLMCRNPVIIRLNCKTFRTYTRCFIKPYDSVLIKTMQDTMLELCQNIDGCVLGYTHTDEITLVLCDYKNNSTQAWYNNDVQKMCSITASMAAVAFNKNLRHEVVNKISENAKLDSTEQYIYEKSYNKALFDSRVYSIPKEDVNNCLVWRQHYAIKNSIQMLAQTQYSTKELQGKNCVDMISMLKEEKAIDWDLLPLEIQRGSCCVRSEIAIKNVNNEKGVYNANDDGCHRNKWIIEREIPLFKQETKYVNSRIMF